MAALFHTTTSATFPESRIIRASKAKRTLALGSLPPPSPGSRRLHFFFFSLFGTQVAWFVIPIFPVFSVRGLEQLAVGSPLPVALPIVVVSSVSIRVSVEGLESSLFWNKVQYWLQLSNRNWELVKIITSSGTESVVSLPDGKTKAGPILVAINPFKKVSLYGNDYIEAYKHIIGNCMHIKRLRRKKTIQIQDTSLEEVHTCKYGTNNTIENVYNSTIHKEHAFTRI
ncbi:hypothetical protein Ahy_A08g041290 [Arachis hypogaea]|uniref:Myosin-1-3 N-terminal SH3 domain-containing protein n=1 Tax=Arachis hypogaea TaxID=3818 RepID=A0A445C290_ARAHY|nr:hypothetical protein Ahy_A08g041290 [Arachis hypogaea]